MPQVDDSEASLDNSTTNQGRTGHRHWPIIGVMLALPIFAPILSLTKITPAEAGGCPIVFDLDGDGQIKTTGLGNGRHKFFSAITMLSTVQFDLRGTGSKQTIEWITGHGDAFLIEKRKWKTDGTMSGDALFGTAGGFRNGFEKLSKFDKNNDGIISGSELKDLAFWQDNGDAVPQPDEYKEIPVYGITEIPYRSVLEAEKLGSLDYGPIRRLSGMTSLLLSRERDLRDNRKRALQCREKSEQAGLFEYKEKT